MAGETTPLENIKARRAEIARQRAIISEQHETLAALDAALDREDRNLSTAERAVAEHTNPTAAANLFQIGEVAASIIARTECVRTRERRKPDGIPTIMQMTRDVLARSTNRWMSGPEIAEAIREQWWPEVETEFITPQLWRAATKRRVLIKNGALYALPHTNEKDPADRAGSSRRNGAAQTSA